MTSARGGPWFPHGEPAEANAVSAGAIAPGRQVLGVRVSSGRGESNPRTRLGRPLHYHCATPARIPQPPLKKPSVSCVAHFVRSYFSTTGDSFFSGCWELNPGHILPRDAYYRYTTPRLLNSHLLSYHLFFLSQSKKCGSNTCF